MNEKTLETGEDLLDMSLRDLLDEYCVLFSPECGYFYGIATIEDAQKVYDDYLEHVSEHPSFSASPLLDMDMDFENLKILKLSDIESILENHLGFSKNKGAK